MESKIGSDRLVNDRFFRGEEPHGRLVRMIDEGSELYGDHATTFDLEAMECHRRIVSSSDVVEELTRCTESTDEFRSRVTVCLSRIATTPMTRHEAKRLCDELKQEIELHLSLLSFKSSFTTIEGLVCLRFLCLR